MKLFKNSLLAGIAIGIGCMANLAVGGGIAGAVLFSIGLLLVCKRSMTLFTGRVCYAVQSHESAFLLLAILLSNIAASAICGAATGIVRPDLRDAAVEIVTKKLNEGWRIIPLAFMCNILIFFAVDTKNDLVLVICVAVFILCGFEHCIANTFYLAADGRLVSLPGLCFLALNILFNMSGGIFAWWLSR